MTTDHQRYAIYDRIMKVYLTGHNFRSGPGDLESFEWSNDGRQALLMNRSDVHQARAGILSTSVDRGGRAFPDAISIITAEEVQVLPPPSASTSTSPVSSNVLLYHPTVEAFYAKHTEAAGPDAGSVTRTFTWDYDPLKALSMSRDEAEQRRQEWQMPALVIMVPSEAARVAAVRQAAIGLAHLPGVGPMGEPRPGQAAPVSFDPNGRLQGLGTAAGSPFPVPPPQPKKEYKILVSDGAGPVSLQAVGLAAQVEQHLVEGWQPIGGVAIGGGMLIQAMGRAR